jgi:hypothetical protein
MKSEKVSNIGTKNRPNKDEYDCKESGYTKNNNQLHKNPMDDRRDTEY